MLTPRFWAFARPQRPPLIRGSGPAVYRATDKTLMSYPLLRAEMDRERLLLPGHRAGGFYHPPASAFAGGRGLVRLYTRPALRGKNIYLKGYDMTPKTKHSAFYNVRRFLPYYKNHKGC